MPLDYYALISMEGGVVGVFSLEELELFMVDSYGKKETNSRLQLLLKHLNSPRWYDGQRLETVRT